MLVGELTEDYPLLTALLGANPEGQKSNPRRRPHRSGWARMDLIMEVEALGMIGR